MRLGYLDEANAKELPSELQGNFANYVRAKNADVTTVGDRRHAEALADAHVQKFGEGKRSYEQAFAKALEAAYGDEEDGVLRYLVRESERTGPRTERER